MAYIGNQPALGNFVKLDAIVTSATATYNLLNGGVAFTPGSANQCIVSLNGVIQEPTSASNVGGFTISGSTIVFTSALTSLDVIDFILVLGDVLNIGTPSDSTVGFAKVTSNLITGATAETSIAGGDTILLFDDSASALRKMTRTNFVSGLGAAAGQVIQVLGATDTTQRSTTSNSFVTASNTLSVTITPSATSSKFAIFVNHYMYKTDGFGCYTIFRDSTNLSGSDGLGFIQSLSGTLDGSVLYCFLDSPNTTSAITYQPYLNNLSATGTIYMGKSNMTAQIIVMEIKG